MGRITEFFLLETPRRHAVVIRAQIPAGELPRFIGEGIARLEAYIETEGVTPCDTPFLRVAADNTQLPEVTVGVELPAPLLGSGEMQPVSFPPGRQVLCYHMGDTGDMAQLYADMRRFAAKRGHRAAGDGLEYPLNGPGQGVDMLLTKVILPLDQSAE